MTIRFRLRWWNLMAALGCVLLPAMMPAPASASLTPDNGVAVIGTAHTAQRVHLHRLGRQPHDAAPSSTPALTATMSAAGTLAVPPSQTTATTVTTTGTTPATALPVPSATATTSAATPPIQTLAPATSTATTRHTVRQDTLAPFLMSSLVVTSSADSGPGTLRDAIAAASPGTTITFAPNLGTIILTSGELLIATTLTISGPASSTQTISGDGLSRVFEITPTVAVTLTNLTITDGQAPSSTSFNVPGSGGGGILNNGTLSISSSVVVSNTAGAGNGNYSPGGDGGGVANTNSGALTINSSTVMSNSAGSGGPLYAGTAGGGNSGGIANSGILTITNSVIISNTGGQTLPASDSGNGGNGGGVANSGALTMISSTVSGNAGGNSSYATSDNGTAGAGGSGGGIANSGTLTVTTSTISNNTAGANPLGAQYSGGSASGAGGGSGGGIDNQGMLTLNGSTVSGNTAGQGGIDSYSGPAGVGGGIANHAQASATIINSTISNNAAGAAFALQWPYQFAPGGNGGGVANEDQATLIISNSTLAGNAAGPADGPAPAGLGNDVAGDAGTTTLGATIIGGSASLPGSDCAGTLIFADYNLLRDTKGCALTGNTIHTITGTDPLLGPLQDNGGPTLTQEPLPDSAAIDQVPSALCPSTDQRGAPRPDDQEGTCDIGAVESGLPAGGTIPWHPHTQVQLTDHLSLSVDLADGHVDLTAAALRLPGRGPDLAYQTTWDSALAQAAVSTTAGLGWVSSVTPHVSGALTQTVVYTDETGAVWSLPYVGPLTATAPYTAYETPAGLPWQLSTAPAASDLTPAYTLTNILSGATRVFDRRGLLLSDGDAWGNQNTVAYSATVSGPVPISLTNSGGRALDVLYGPNGLPWGVQSPLGHLTYGQLGQQVVYGYNTAGQISGMAWGYGSADQIGAAFTYSGTQLLTVTTLLGQQWGLHYDAQGRVSALVSPAALTPAGYTPPYATVFVYNPGQTLLIKGYDAPGQQATIYDLDAQGEPITVTDALGDSTVYSYDQDHDVVARTDANHHTTTNLYQYVGSPGPGGLGSTGLVTETDGPAIDSTGPVTTGYRYDSANNLVETISGNGGITYLGYDAPRHAVITTTQMLALACGQSAPLRATRPGPGQGPRQEQGQAPPGARRPVTPQSAPCGPTPVYSWRGTVTSYNPFGEPVSVVDGRGVDVQIASASTPPPATLDPTSAPLYTHSYTYTAQGDLRAAISPPLTTDLGGTVRANQPVTTTYYPDADGNVAAVVSPNYGVTALTYDHLGRTVEITAPAIQLYTGASVAPTSTIQYDGDGNIARTTDGDGNATSYAHDPMGRLVATTDALGQTTLYTYSATEPITTRDAALNLTGFSYDPAGRLRALTDPRGTATQYQYDQVGNTTAITTPLAYGSVLTDTIEARDYDPLNELATDTIGGVGAGGGVLPAQTRQTSYDHDGQVVQDQAGSGAASYHGYDLADRPAWVHVLATALTAPLTNPPPQATTFFSFDNADNPIDRQDDGLRDHAASFDGADRLTQEVDGYYLQTPVQAITTTLLHDPDGNPASITRQDGGQTITTTAYHNAQDAPVYQDDGQGATSYGYDAAGNVRLYSLLGGFNQGFAVTTLNGDELVSGLTADITDTGGSPAVTTNGFTYTPDNRPLADTLNSSGGAGRVTQSRQYDGDNHLTQLTTTPLLGSAFDQSYGYDAQGHTVAITQGGGLPTDYLYNAQGQLTGASGATAGGWSYDGAGNLTSDGPNSYQYTYPAGEMTPTDWLPGELVSWTRNSDNHFLAYGYDASGDTATIADRAGGPGSATVTQTLSYNAQGLLSGVTVSNADNTPKAVVGLTYNARGLRATDTVTPTGAMLPSFSEALRYRGSQVGQVVVSGTATTPFTETFLYRPDGAPLELLYQTQDGQGHNHATVPYWYLLDGRDNVVGLVNGSGSLIDSYVYDAWGAPQLTAPGWHDPLPQPLRYGGYWDDGWDDSLSPGTWDNGPLSWYWLQTRAYDPALKRFLQPDPASQTGLPDYVYAADDPLDVTDPSGQDGLPAACGQASYTSNPAQAAACVQQAEQQQDHARTLQALWAVPNFLLLDPLRDTFGPSSSPGQRVLGALALVPFAGVLGHGIGLAADAARGLTGARDVETAVGAVEGATDTGRYLYRGERASMAPEIVFENGFVPKGENTNLLEHVTTNTAGSNYIATSKSEDIAFQFAGKNGYVYKIFTSRGIDVNEALGAASPFPEQLEVAIPGGVSPTEIVGAFVKRGGELTGEFIANSNFLEP